MSDDRGETDWSGRDGAGAGAGRRRYGAPRPAGGQPGASEPRGHGRSEQDGRGGLPRYDQPGRDQPRYERPRPEQPSYERPRYEQPSYERPRYEPPGYDEPRVAPPRQPREPAAGRSDPYRNRGQSQVRLQGEAGPRAGYRDYGSVEVPGAAGRPEAGAYGAHAAAGTATRPPSVWQAPGDADAPETETAGGASRGPGRGTERDRKRGRRRRIIKWTALGTASVLVLAIAFGGYWWYRLNHNINTAALHGTSPVNGVVAEKADPFGRTPINILLMGSDGRNNAADCKIGGVCDLGATGSNADVEMLLHVSADRSNATIVSIPRDTEVPIPQCTDAKGQVHPPQQMAMINSALQVSPSCQVDTVEELTHVQIDHFIEVDFQGVVNITDAVGGVPVCVSAAVHDPDSHLNLPAGTSIVRGLTALEFLRSRHGFGDGSDLYRTQVQHQYMSSLVRQLRKEGSVTNTGTLLHIADVATKSLTVDNGLDGLTKLMDLAGDLKKVPTDRITFMTMPTQTYLPDPAHVAPEQPADNQIFSMINNDVSATKGAKAKPAAPPSTPPAAVPSSVGGVVVANGTDSPGRAGQVAGTLGAAGFTHTSSVNYGDDTETQTVVRYTAGQQPAAEAVAKALHVPAAQVKSGSTGGGDVEVVIGDDFTTGTTFSAATSSDGSLSTSLASQAASENAANSKVCAKANPDD